MKKMLSAAVAAFMLLQGMAVSYAAPPTDVLADADIELKKVTSTAYENGPLTISAGATVDFHATLDTANVKEAVKAYYEKAVSEVEALTAGDSAAKARMMADIHTRPITGRFTINVTYPKGVEVSAADKTGGSMYGFNNEAKRVFAEVSRSEDTTDAVNNVLKIEVKPVSPSDPAQNLTVGDLCGNNYEKLDYYLPQLEYTLSGARMSNPGVYTVTATLTGYTDFGISNATHVTYTGKQKEGAENPEALNTISATVFVLSRISGNITNGGTENIPSYTIDLKQGNNSVASTGGGAIAPGGAENYEIVNVENGVYNIVVKSGDTTKTVYAEVDSYGAVLNDIRFVPRLSSVLKVDAEDSQTATKASPSALGKSVVDGLDIEVESGVTGGLYESAQKRDGATLTPKGAYNAGGRVELELIVSPKDAVTAASTGTAPADVIKNKIYESQQKISEKVKADTQAGYTYSIADFYDLSLKLRWWDASNAAQHITNAAPEADGTTIETANSTLHIAFPYSINSGDVIKMYRHHGNDAQATELEALTAMPAVTEWSSFDRGSVPAKFYADTERGIIHVFARNFSMYAIVKVQPEVPVSSGSSTYRLVYNIDGKTGDISPITGKRGSKVLVSALPKPVKDGYTFDGWYFDAARTKKVTEDIILVGNIVLYGHWVSDVLDSETHFAYIYGYPDGTVRPTADISREEVAAIFSRLMTQERKQELLPKTDESAFSDVTADRWSYEAISVLANGKYIEGYEDGTFRPEAPITRAEFATMATRFVNLYEVGEPVFTDISGHWGEVNILKAAAAGWITGYEDATFRPDSYITRAEAMAIINRVLTRAVNKEGLHGDARIWSDVNESDWYYYVVEEATNSHEYARGEDGLNENWTKVGLDIELKK